MVVRYQWLYKQKKEGESELDALSRRLSFKLPIVVRYNIGFALFFGFTHAIFAKNQKWIYRYLFVVPFGIAGLSHQEIYHYLQIKGYAQRVVGVDVGGPNGGKQQKQAAPVLKTYRQQTRIVF